MTIEKIDYIKQNKELITSLFNSPKFTALIESLLVPYQNLQDPLLWLANNLLNIDVAQGWHLDFIGMHPRVQQPRVLVNFNPNPYFGFKGTNGTEAYKSETFSSISNPSLGGLWNSYTHIDGAGSRRLTDEEYRRVLKARIVFNNATGSINDILRVVNLITNNNLSVINVAEHRKLRLKYSDPTGLLDYFISRLDRADNIIPVSLGVTLEVVSFHSDELGSNTPTNPETDPQNLLGVDTINLKRREVGTLFYSRSSNSDATATVTLTDLIGPIVVSDTSGDFNNMFKGFTRYGYQVSIDDATEDEYATYIGNVDTSWVTKKVTISANDYSITLSVNSSNLEQGVIKLIPTEQEG